MGYSITSLTHMDDPQMAYVESGRVGDSSSAKSVWRGVVTPAARRAEGVSARRLVVVVDVAILTGFVAVQATRTGFAFAILAFLALKGAGVYGPRLRPRTGEDLPRIVAAVAVALLALFFVSPADQALAIGRAAPFFLLALLIGRSATYTAIRTARTSGRLRERVLIVGADERGVDMARLILE